MNLQYGDVAGEIRLVKRQTDVDIIEAPDIDKNDDLDGLSHLISACDYIVTIDNFIAHLSGALGRTLFCCRETTIGAGRINKTQVIGTIR